MEHGDRPMTAAAFTRRDDLREFTLRLVPAVAVAAAAFLAVTPFLRAYRVPGRDGYVAAAVAGPVAIAFSLARIWRRSSTWSYLCSAVGLVVVLLAGSGFHPVGIARAIVHGPNRVLTETLPLTGSRVSMSALVVMAWLSAAALAELIFRARPERRGGAAGLAVPVGVYALAYAVAASAPGRDLVSGPLLLAAVAGLSLLRQREFDTTGRVVSQPGPEGAEPGPRQLPAPIKGAAVVAVLAVVLALVVPTIPRMSKAPASLHRAAPTAVGLVVDPVDAMAALRDGEPTAPVRTVLDVALSQPSTGYLAIAALDSYDGLLWRFSTTFQPTGGRIPAVVPTLRAARAGAPVQQKVLMAGSLPVPLLPALDRLISVSGLAVVADPATGMVLPATAPKARISYTAVSYPPLVTLSDLSSADSIGHDAASIGASIVPADSQLPADTSAALATTLRSLSALTKQRPAPTVAFLQAVADALRARDSRVDPSLKPFVARSTPRPRTRAKGKTKAPPTTTTVPQTASVGGTSLSEAIDDTIIGRAATPEQFATLVAMVARYLGVPARLVTGFRLAGTSGGGQIGAGSYSVTNRQAWAWVEVPVVGVGWVVLDPTPDSVVPLNQPREQVAATPPTIPPRPAAAIANPTSQGGHAVAKKANIAIPRSHPVPTWVVALVAVGILLVVAGALGPGQAAVRRAQRRRARRVADPSGLAVGAWLELLDGLNRAGMRTAHGATNLEVAADAGSHFGPEVVPTVRHVGSVADRAVFSTQHPPDRASADEAWKAQDAVRRVVYRSLDRRQRVRALLSVGSSPRAPTSAADHR